MGKPKNMKNRATDKHSPNESHRSSAHSTERAESPTITDKDLVTGKSPSITDKNLLTDKSPITNETQKVVDRNMKDKAGEVKETDKKMVEKKTETTNAVEKPEHKVHFVPDDDNAVDRAMATAHRMWKMWAVMGLVAGAVAVIGKTEVPTQSEELVVEKGVALLVSRPTVFKYVGELSNYRMWYPGIARFDQTDATPMGIGKHFTEVLQVPLYGEVLYDNVVVGYESPHYISFVSDSWLRIRVEVEVTRRDSPRIPTSLKYRVHARPTTVFDKYVVLPCMRFVYNNRVRQAMFNIRFVFAK